MTDVSYRSSISQQANGLFIFSFNCLCSTQMVEIRPTCFQRKGSQLEETTWTIEFSHDNHYDHIKSDQFGWMGWEWSVCVWRSELFLSFVTVPKPSTKSSAREDFYFLWKKMIGLAYLDYIQSRPRYRNITSVPNPPHQTWLHTKEAWKISEDQGGESAGNSCYASLKS